MSDNIVTFFAVDDLSVVFELFLTGQSAACFVAADSPPPPYRVHTLSPHGGGGPGSNDQHTAMDTGGMNQTGGPARYHNVGGGGGAKNQSGKYSHGEFCTCDRLR